MMKHFSYRTIERRKIVLSTFFKCGLDALKKYYQCDYIKREEDVLMGENDEEGTIVIINFSVITF